ncbi:MAG: ATP-binding protein, partial [Bacteroidia bacterium]|nr:ATP-binding protein [Bacteroidia bacterium]
MARTYSVRDILTKKYDLIKWSSKFSEHFGFPENRGVWFIAGMTGSGKSTFVYDLISELSLLGRVLINSLEEATDYTVQQKVINSNLHDKKVNVNWCRENTAELTMRLKKRRSPKYVIIDSIHYLD